MAVPVPTSRQRSSDSRGNTSRKSLLYFKHRTLGDKLQRLGNVSPGHLRTVELVVDLMLRRIDTTKRAG